jgi:acyl dehydratase
MWPITITQAHIDAYAEVSGDFNPVHVDPEFARTTPYGSTIAHGTISAALIVRDVVHRLGTVDRLRRLSVRFVAAVRPGDILRCEARPRPDASDLAPDEEAYEVECINQRGELVTIGQAVLQTGGT